MSRYKPWSDPERLALVDAAQAAELAYCQEEVRLTREAGRRARLELGVVKARRAVELALRAESASSTPWTDGTERDTRDAERELDAALEAAARAHAHYVRRPGRAVELIRARFAAAEDLRAYENARPPFALEQDA